jgi:hypothetical protein
MVSSAGCATNNETSVGRNEGMKVFVHPHITHHNTNRAVGIEPDAPEAVPFLQKVSTSMGPPGRDYV